MVFGVPNPAPDPKGPRDTRMGAVESDHWSAKVARATKLGQQGWGRNAALLIGVDEAGRGPLAGPVSVAAAVFSPRQLSELKSPWMHLVDDSKRLTESARSECFEGILKDAKAWAIAHVHPRHIDEVNILQATYHGMALVVEAILGLDSTWPARPALIEGNVAEAQALWYADKAPMKTHLLAKPLSRDVNSARVLVDGNRPFKVAGARAPFTQYPVVKGDALSFHIAAASVLAKVSRDAFMTQADEEWPEYGFKGHKGYPTKAHRAAVTDHGPCAIHRRTFKGVREHIAQVEEAETDAEESGQAGLLC